MTVTVDVLIPTCERPAALAVTLTALAASTSPPMRIVVSDQSESVPAAVQPEVEEAPALMSRPLVLLQPGSTDPRRCWPAASFAAVGDALAGMGAQGAVNGTAAEALLVRRVIDRMAYPAIDLSGKLSLGGLCGLIERAACVVSNDTGPLHLALAIGRPAVGIFWLTNLIDGMPLRQGLLRAALSLRQECPVCGALNLSSRCAHDASFLADVPVEQVIAMAADILDGAQGASSR